MDTNRHGKRKVEKDQRRRRINQDIVRIKMLQGNSLLSVLIKIINTSLKH